MKLDWRVALGAGVVLLLMIGSYFLGRYQQSDARRKLPSPVVNAPETPLDTSSTVIAPQLDSGSETVTEVMDAADTSESEQVIGESIVQLRIKQVKVEAELDQLNSLRNKLSNQRGLEHERVTTETMAHQKEVDRLNKILEAKLGPKPTLEEIQSTEEGQQLRKLRREDDSVEATLAVEETYEQKMKEIEQKETELLEERLAIMGRIKDLMSQLAGEY